MRYFIHLAYNGTPYHGWQIQPNATSVQETLENAFSLLLGEAIGIVGCGRTDTGVHASDFYAHFETKQELSDTELTQLTFKANSFLSEDIRIYRIFVVNNDVHARFSATARTYQYHVSNVKQPFGKDFCHRVFYKPDIELMNQAANILFEYTDFTSFSKLHTQTATNNCTILYARWDMVGEEYVFTISANRFLRNMVRAITGTLLEVGRGKLSLDDFRKVIESKNRCNAGTSLPAKALFLTKVEYEGIF